MCNATQRACTFVALVALAACLLAPPAAAVNLDWIPADPDGPLPASREYRDRLFQLCIAMRKTPAFFAEIDPSKQTVIRSLCRRLREAERAERLPSEYAAGHQQASSSGCSCWVPASPRYGIIESRKAL